MHFPWVLWTELKENAFHQEDFPADQWAKFEIVAKMFFDNNYNWLKIGYREHYLYSLEIKDTR